MEALSHTISCLKDSCYFIFSPALAFYWCCWCRLYLYIYLYIYMYVYFLKHFLPSFSMLLLSCDLVYTSYIPCWYIIDTVYFWKHLLSSFRIFCLALAFSGSRWDTCGWEEIKGPSISGNIERVHLMQCNAMHLVAAGYVSQMKACMLLVFRV